MGLDNGFILKKKSDPNFKLEVAYFRKFFELDTWIRSICSRVDENDDCLYSVTYEDLKMLKEDLYPIAKVLIQIPERLITKYDNHGYPKKYKLESDELIHEEFNPIVSGSAFAGWKTRNLYSVVCWLMHFLDIYDIDNNGYYQFLDIYDIDNNGYYIEFYSSY